MRKLLIMMACIPLILSPITTSAKTASYVKPIISVSFFTHIAIIGLVNNSTVTIDGMEYSLFTAYQELILNASKDISTGGEEIKELHTLLVEIKKLYQKHSLIPGMTLNNAAKNDVIKLQNSFKQHNEFIKINVDKNKFTVKVKDNIIFESSKLSNRVKL